jgi:hypothetical protein
VPKGALSELQRAVLEVLAPSDPPWTLTGGGALVEFHLGHRSTRDLDLFLHGRATLEEQAERAADRLRGAGMEVTSIQGGSSLQRYRVTRGRLLDLVADPVPVVEAPTRRSIGRVEILVDTPHEILVNKLCALVQRSELRDLVDVRGLLGASGDLERALRDAPRKDGGFSPLVLSWQLEGLDLISMGRAEGWTEHEVAELAAFRTTLIARLSRLSHPGPG